MFWHFKVERPRSFAGTVSCVVMSELLSHSWLEVWQQLAFLNKSHVLIDPSKGSLESPLPIIFHTFFGYLTIFKIIFEWLFPIELKNNVKLSYFLFLKLASVIDHDTKLDFDSWTQQCNMINQRKTLFKASPCP